jgi:hypothetical protein
MPEYCLISGHGHFLPYTFQLIIHPKLHSMSYWQNLITGLQVPGNFLAEVTHEEFTPDKVSTFVSHILLLYC